jgi:hypothetical protein
MKTQQNFSPISPVSAISMLAAVVVIALVLGVTDTQDDLDGRQANYCELRQIHIDSGGLYGWPVLQGYGECK